MMSYAAWCRNMFESMSDGGVWGIPRSGLIFEKKGDELVLLTIMPWSPGMPTTSKELELRQYREFLAVQDWFGQAGIDVTSLVAWSDR